MTRLGNHGGSSRGLAGEPLAITRLSGGESSKGNVQLPVGRKDTDRLVVAGQTVDTRLNENETELGVLVLAVALEVLADGNSLEHSRQYLTLPTRHGHRKCAPS
jgi:hypothetical protein